ncbi:MAG: HAMP domain-containing histidine kinase [Myxococcales bacterium]|nr:HAMP domain-containing histidine kinase [Myxococcales bacterium]
MSLARDVASFLAAALVPAAAVGWLGLRASKNEEAALRREATLEVARAADLASRAVEDGLERAARDLAELSPTPARAEDSAALATALSRVADAAPAFAEAAVLTADGRVLLPRTQRGSTGDGGEDAACRQVAAAFDELRTQAERRAVLDCPEARDSTGRWIFPVIAIDELGRAPDAALSTELASFFEGHAALMRPEERAIAHDEVALLRGLPEATRARVIAALEHGALANATLGPSLARVWRSEPALRALASGEGARRFEGTRAAGVVRRIGEGLYVGLVVTPETLGRALASEPSPFLVPDGVVVEVAADDARARPDAVEAVAFVTEGLGFHARLARPAVLAERTSKSARVLGGLIAASAALAVGLATLLFLRVRAARRTSELRTSFVAAVSHELKTPIASMQMLSELFAQGRVDESERAEVAEALAREARRMGDTVERFLAYARMERGKLVARRARHDLRALVDDRLRAFRARHPDLSSHVEGPESLEADVDRAQIELVLDNLLENAAKYAPLGAPYVVGLRSEGAHVELRVSDRGPGVPPSLRRRIFRPFERGDDRLSRATEGTGLGLALVRAAARAHGGSADVEDSSGGGATFVVRFPREAPAEQETT